MKLDQLLEQMLAQKCTDDNNRSTSIGGTNETINDAGKSEQVGMLLSLIPYDDQLAVCLVYGLRNYKKKNVFLVIA